MHAAAEVCFCLSCEVRLAVPSQTAIRTCLLPSWSHLARQNTSADKSSFHCSALQFRTTRHPNGMDEANFYFGVRFSCESAQKPISQHLKVSVLCVVCQELMVQHRHNAYIIFGLYCPSIAGDRLLSGSHDILQLVRTFPGAWTVFVAPTLLLVVAARHDAAQVPSPQTLPFSMLMCTGRRRS